MNCTSTHSCIMRLQQYDYSLALSGPHFGHQLILTFMFVMYGIRILLGIQYRYQYQVTSRSNISIPHFWL
jgi:hypothetical protein